MVNVRARSTMKILEIAVKKKVQFGYISARTLVLLVALIVLGLYANSRSWHAHESSLSASDRSALLACRSELLNRAAPALSIDPVQSKRASCAPFMLNDVTVTPLADFVVQARVLGKERYRFDAAAKWAPIDLALGWGQMANDAVLKHIEISQSGRFFFWMTPNFPIPRQEIERSSANMHLLPANDQVLSALGRAKPGQYVRLWGYLVRLNRADGYLWASSMSRTDTGSGACEVIWVEKMEIGDVPIGV